MGIAQRGHDVLLFDRTSDALPGKHPRFTWFCEGVAAVSEPERSLLSLATHWTSCRAGVTNFEGGYRGCGRSVLRAIPADLLIRLEEIGLELHHLDELDKSDVQRCRTDIIGETGGAFHAGHVRANDFCSVAIVGGFPAPGTDVEAIWWSGRPPHRLSDAD
jgi:hypothetical protein